MRAVQKWITRCHPSVEDRAAPRRGHRVAGNTRPEVNGGARQGYSSSAAIRLLHALIGGRRRRRVDGGIGATARRGGADHENRDSRPRMPGYRSHGPMTSFGSGSEWQTAPLMCERCRSGSPLVNAVTSRSTRVVTHAPDSSGGLPYVGISATNGHGVMSR